MRQGFAIVGMACRYPDANSPDQLWENVLAQRRAFRQLPRERLNVDDYCSDDRSAVDKTYCVQAAVLEADSADALVGWLKQHGYAYSPAVRAWAKPPPQHFLAESRTGRDGKSMLRNEYQAVPKPQVPEARLTQTSSRSLRANTHFWEKAG